MPGALEETGQSKTDKKRIKGSGRHDWEKMRSVVKELLNDRPVDKKHRDHELSGEYEGVRESPIEPDWLLIHDKEGHAKPGALQLIRTGTHSDLLWRLMSFRLRRLAPTAPARETLALRKDPLLLTQTRQGRARSGIERSVACLARIPLGTTALA